MDWTKSGWTKMNWTKSRSTIKAWYKELTAVPSSRCSAMNSSSNAWYSKPPSQAIEKASISVAHQNIRKEDTIVSPHTQGANHIRKEHRQTRVKYKVKISTYEKSTGRLASNMRPNFSPRQTKKLLSVLSTTAKIFFQANFCQIHSEI